MPVTDQVKDCARNITILPAGAGHRFIDASKLVIGACPATGTDDECADTRERAQAVTRIAKVRKPRHDPVSGQNRPLMKLWQKPRR